MFTQFLSFISDNDILAKDDKLLIAASGGIDSMVLIDLCLKAGIEIGLAHINHNLRGVESKKDEAFIKLFCQENNLPCHIKSLDIGEMVKKEKANMHELARRERYLFFEKTRSFSEYHKIATAHHGDDKIEGFFLNLLRGAGLNGLTGIKNNVNSVIRPLLFTTKDEIITYAKKHKIPYREDQSNASIKYRRNYIRHRLIPIIAEIKPAYQTTIIKSIDQLDDSLTLLDHMVQSNLSHYKEIAGEMITIHIDNMISTPGRTTLLHLLINPYGFTTSQVKSIFKSINHTGARFISNDHNAIINRKKLLIKKRNQQIGNNSYVLNEHSTITIPSLGQLKTTTISSSIPLDQAMVLLDAKKIQFPLIVRRWKPGDRFQPAGMNGNFKKVKKYLTDIKLSLFEKENTFVLLSGDDICWVIGHRVDERYKGNELLIRLIPSASE